MIRKAKRTKPPRICTPEEAREHHRRIDYERRDQDCPVCHGVGSTRGDRYIDGSHETVAIYCRECSGTGRIDSKAHRRSTSEPAASNRSRLARRLADAAERILESEEGNDE